MACDIEIRHIKKDDTELITLWNKLVTENDLPPQALFTWKENLEGVFGTKSYTLLAIDQDMRARGFTLVFFHSGEETLYTCRYGFFAQDNLTAQALYTEIRSIALQHKIKKTVITSGTLELELAGRKESKESLYLPLDYINEEQLWLSIPKKTKNMIRKAEKTGLTVTSDWKYIDEFYNIYTERFIEKTLSIKPLKHFLSLKELFGERAVFIGALQGETIIAGMIFISTSNAVSYAYNASNLNASNNGANNLIMWEAMKLFHKEKVKYIDLSESKPESPVYKFKTRLSKGIMRKTIYYYDCLSNDKTTKTPSITMFVTYKCRGLLHRLVPIMPSYLKKIYLLYLGSRGRVV